MPNHLLDKLPTRITTWSTLARVHDIFHRVEGDVEQSEEWVFRGHVESDWSLITTLDRVAEEFGIPGDEIPDLEVRLILEFMRRYHLYGAEPPPSKGDTVDWLALMRHHGAPTRLLDFTFSFLVAACFALESKSKGTAVVWAINKTWLTNEVKKSFQKLGKGVASQFRRYLEHRDSEPFRDIFMKRRPVLVSAISAFRLNQRVTVQQGLFQCPGDVSKTFEDNLHAMRNWERNIKRIEIPSGARPSLLTAMLRSNLTTATLFPGLDGFATSLWTRVPSLRHLQSMEIRGARSRLNLGIDALGDH